MRTSSTERIDQLALVWLAIPRKESRLSGFHPQLERVAKGADHQKRLAQESIDRLRERGLIQPGRALKLTEEGHRLALGLLGVSRIPPSRTALNWAKKMLLLRSVGITMKPAKAAKPGAKGELSLSQIAAALAWRALGLEERPTFALQDAFVATFLEDASPPRAASDGRTLGSVGPASEAVALRLGDCTLRDFAAQVNDAARSSRTGRWHDAVFISHVWNTLRARGNVGITFEDFQRRLVEAHQADLIELSRADLVDAMPTADVSESETHHFGARFHFIRLEQLAS